MPSDALSDAIKEAYASAPSNDVVLETIQITHSLLEDDIFLVKNRENIIATLETDEEVEFEAVAFNLSKPASGNNGLQELRIGIDNVDRRISDLINTVKKSKEATLVYYRVFLASDLSQPQNNPPLLLTLSDVSLNLFEAAGRASFADVINRKCPSEIYSRKRFPSLGN